MKSADERMIFAISKYYFVCFSRQKSIKKYQTAISRQIYPIYVHIIFVLVDENNVKRVDLKCLCSPIIFKQNGVIKMSSIDTVRVYKILEK